MHERIFIIYTKIQMYCHHKIAHQQDAGAFVLDPLKSRRADILVSSDLSKINKCQRRLPRFADVP